MITILGEGKSADERSFKQMLCFQEELWEDVYNDMFMSLWVV